LAPVLLEQVVMKPNVKTILLTTCAVAGNAFAGSRAPSGPDFATGPAPALQIPRGFAAAPVVGDVLPIDVIPFRYDRAAVSRLDLGELGAAARWLEAHPGYSLVIESHADAHGSDAYNAVLSARRALVVRDWLVELGAPPDRVVTASFGESRPVATDPFAASNRIAVVYATPHAPAAIAESFAADGAAVLEV
jgi:outer membrane protein OmpA-like peptidoglycan-associated protein